DRFVLCDVLRSSDHKPITDWPPPPLLSCARPTIPKPSNQDHAQISIRLLQRLDIPIPQTYYTESDFGRVCRGCLRRDLRHRPRTPVKGMIHPTCLCVIWRMRLWI